jgi:hypothetical protein
MTNMTATTTTTFLLVGNYGSFTVSREIDLVAADSVDLEDEAYAATGIGTDLEAAGWVVEFHDDAEWTIERVA